MSIGTVALMTVGWLAGWLLAGRPRSLASVTRPDACPSVSVIVPARNEETRLPRLLACLASAVPPPSEVLVVDDSSTDSTALIARRAGARVLHVSPPAGWTGKAWACQRGADEATGDVLVFLDADTEPGPDAVATLAGRAAAGELVSAQPRHRVERAYERLSAGPALVTVLGAGMGPPPTRRWWRRPMAFGPAIAVPRGLYRHIGGHAAVRAEVAEDLALARVADGAGLPVRSFLGGSMLGYRMYPEGLGGLVEGWSKNLATGAGAIPPARLAATILWVTAALQAALSPVASFGAPAVVVYVAFVGQVGWLLRRLGRFGAVTAAVYPIPVLAFVLLFARSIVLTVVRGSVSWRGRRLAVRA